MDLVWITKGIPYPPDQGDRIVVYNRIKSLSERGHNVHVFSIMMNEVDYDRVNKFRNEVAELHIFKSSSGVSDYVKNLFPISVPYNVQINTSSKLVNKARNLIKSNDINVVFIDHLYVSGNSMADTEAFIGIHNLEHKWYWDSAKLAFPHPKAIAYALEAARWYFYEDQIYENNKYSDYEFVSYSELDWVENHYSHLKNNLNVSSIGVDFSRFKNVTPADITQEKTTIVFTGSMESSLNSDAVVWFSNNVFPEVKEEIPDAQFLIVGSNPSKRVEQLSDVDDIIVTGRVDFIEPYIVGADLVVIPLRGGAGVKVKLLEALAAEKLVLTTKYGISGTKITANEEVLLANSENSFSDKAIKSLKHPEKYKKIQRAGHKYAHEHHDWSEIIDNLEERIEENISSNI